MHSRYLSLDFRANEYSRSSEYLRGAETFNWTEDPLQIMSFKQLFNDSGDGRNYNRVLHELDLLEERVVSAFQPMNATCENSLWTLCRCPWPETWNIGKINISLSKPLICNCPLKVNWKIHHMKKKEVLWIERSPHTRYWLRHIGWSSALTEACPESR